MFSLSLSSESFAEVGDMGREFSEERSAAGGAGRDDDVAVDVEVALLLLLF
jgi:hypothetical protein